METLKGNGFHAQLFSCRRDRGSAGLHNKFCSLPKRAMIAEQQNKALLQTSTECATFFIYIRFLLRSKPQFLLKNIQACILFFPLTSGQLLRTMGGEGPYSVLFTTLGQLAFLWQTKRSTPVLSKTRCKVRQSNTLTINCRCPESGVGVGVCLTQRTNRCVKQIVR